MVLKEELSCGKKALNPQTPKHIGSILLIKPLKKMGNLYLVIRQLLVRKN